MTETRLTPGPWADDKPFQKMEFVDEYMLVQHAEIYRANRDLVLAAVNACFALNPTDPLAAAQGLEELVKAAQTVVDESAAEFKDERMNYEVWQITNGVLGGLKAAISRVTGKV